MKTALDNLLESIDPSQTIDKVSARVDEAINTFEINSGIIEEWETFRSLLSNFVNHLLNSILGIECPEPPTPEFYWGQCVRFLSKQFGPNGDIASFEIVRTGKQGGLYAVLKAISEQMVKEYSGNEISARVTDFWNQFPQDERMIIVDEYLMKYGHLLPDELTEGNAVRVRLNFVKILNEHSHLIRKIRRGMR